MSLLDVEFDRLQKLILNESIDADGGLDILPEAKNKNVRGLSPLKKRTPSHLSKRQKARNGMLPSSHLLGELAALILLPLLELRFAG